MADFRTKHTILKQLEESMLGNRHVRNEKSQAEYRAIQDAIMDDTKVTIERTSPVYKAIHNYSFFFSTVLQEWVDWK